MEQIQAPSSLQDVVKKSSCKRPCCQCKPARIMRDNCIKSNEANSEEVCKPFIDAFKMCIQVKREEMQKAKEAAAAAATASNAV
mmetsp:Transcript_7406/g.12507  ORF Transcript_7406/g.12507 Transcript_7406/m.12507 type:complete len:84 (+) Transcript_7406:39-290(+)